jgi:ribokinase
MNEPAAPAVVVLGSAHMDLIAAAGRLPANGESVTGDSFAMVPGGKGGNQACQFALAGARTRIVTRIGDDFFGQRLLAALKAKGVGTEFVALDPTATTGTSTVLSSPDDYSSIIVPGAAARLSTENVEAARPALESADALVVQLELPSRTSRHAAEIAAAAGTRVILNASPMPDAPAAIPESLWRATSILVVNRVEASRLLGRPVHADGAEAAAAELANTLGVATVVITLGRDGSAAATEGETFRQPAFPATLVDPVGAGDAFLGMVATVVLERRPVPDALSLGTAAAALALSRRGVYDALPTRRDVEAFLTARGEP